MKIQNSRHYIQTKICYIHYSITSIFIHIRVAVYLLVCGFNKYQISKYSDY